MEPTICNTSFCCSLSTLSARAVSSVCKQMPSRSVDIHGSAGRGHSASLWIGFPQPTEDTRRIQWHPESLKLSPQWKHPPKPWQTGGLLSSLQFRLAGMWRMWSPAQNTLAAATLQVMEQRDWQLVSRKTSFSNVPGWGLSDGLQKHSRTQFTAIKEWGTGMVSGVI